MYVMPFTSKEFIAGARKQMSLRVVCMKYTKYEQLESSQLESYKCRY